MSDEPTTKPTLDTLLELVRATRGEMREGFQRVNHKLDNIDTRLDRIERKVGLLNQDILSLRADIAGMDERVSKLEDSRS